MTLETTAESKVHQVRGEGRILFPKETILVLLEPIIANPSHRPIVLSYLDIAEEMRAASDGTAYSKESFQSVFILRISTSNVVSDSRSSQAS